MTAPTESHRNIAGGPAAVRGILRLFGPICTQTSRGRSHGPKEFLGIQEFFLWFRAETLPLPLPPLRPVTCRLTRRFRRRARPEARSLAAAGAGLAPRLGVFGNAAAAVIPRRPLSRMSPRSLAADERQRRLPMTVGTILLIVALVCFVLAAFGFVLAQIGRASC